MALTRQNLIDEALANLGIVQATPGAGTGTQTRAALINKALFNLGILSEGRPVRAAEVASVTASLDPIIANLSAHQVITVTDTNAIPNQYFLPLAAIVAASLMDEYGVTGTEAQQLSNNAIAARKNLINLSRTSIIDRNIDAILSDLAARDIVFLVDITDIPEEWFTHLAWIVADRCKNKGFELEADVIQKATEEGANAVMMLREMTRGRPSYNIQRGIYF